MPQDHKCIDVLKRMQLMNLDDHECIALLRDVFPGSSVGKKASAARSYVIQHNGTVRANISLNKKGDIKEVLIAASDEQHFEVVEKDNAVEHPPKVIGTTLFTTRPVTGYARVENWAQIRATDSEVEDLTLLGQWPNVPVPDGRPFPFSLEVCYSPSSLALLDAQRRNRAMNEAILLMTAFLALPVFRPREAFAYTMINQKLSLVECRAPTLVNLNENKFSDVSSLQGLKAIEHEVYFAQLGIGHSEFRVPNLSSLRAAFCKLSSVDQKKFLRACANLSDIASPSMSESSRIVAGVIAIEALLDDGERCERCNSHVGISKSFKNFVTKFVAPATRIIELYDALYPSRSRLAHGAWRLDVDESIFGLAQDVGLTKLVAWSAAKRGLVNWLLATAGSDV
jgi:hypothetical protein